MHRILLTAAAVLAFAAPAAAQEATPTPAPAPPPANDAREAAAPLAVPQTVRGTTVGATAEANEPPTCLGEPAAGVWYAISAAKERDLVLELDAAGDLDATVDVFRRERSQLTSVGCEQTDRKGRLTFDFSQPDDAQLLVRVAPRANSVQDAFTLRVVAPDAAEPPPGRALPAAGAAGTVDRIANPDDAYAVSLKAGRSYRIHLLSRGRCVQAGLYPPGTTGFRAATPVRALDCDDYVLFTPGAGEGGRYSLQVVAPRARRGALPYRVQVAAAGADDTAPGVPLANRRRAKGALRGSGADVVDLYRFAVTRRSILDLRLRQDGDAAFDLRLVTGGGRRVACACSSSGDQSLRLKLKPGRYFAAVRSRAGADGAYTLRRFTRTITALSVNVGGRVKGTKLAPGSVVRPVVRVAPGANGAVVLTFERLDPLAGWQFKRQVRTRAAGGVARPGVSGLGEGRWRVTATFPGTRTDAPSGPKTAYFALVPPLDED